MAFGVYGTKPVNVLSAACTSLQWKEKTKKVFEKVDHRLHVVHAPHRWYALEEEVHGVNQLRIVGGVSNCCLQHGLNFYDGREVVPQTTETATSTAGQRVSRPS